jgi:CHAT domain-containing protein/Tfp pilus assembly protein PilF
MAYLRQPHPTFLPLPSIHYGLVLCLCLWAILTSSVSQAAQGSQEARALEAGKPIERELPGGQAHFYSVVLTSGQYLRVIVDQRGIDVALMLFGPDGKKLAEMDSPNGDCGPESASLIAEKEGNYRVAVSSPEKTAAPGGYKVSIAELRAAIPSDATRLAAEKAFAEAASLRVQGTAAALNQALEKYQQALPVWHAIGERQLEALTLKELGIVYNGLAELDKSLGSYQQALPLWRAVGDRGQEARTLHSIGLHYKQRLAYQQALDYHQQALQLALPTGDQALQALLLNDIGHLCFVVGRHQQAFDYYRQALPLWRALGDRRGEVATLMNIGLAHWALSEHHQALEAYDQVLPLVRALGNRQSEAETLTNIGLAYCSIGEYQRALVHYGQALQLWRALGHRFGQARALIDMGRVYAWQGEAQQAGSLFEQALALKGIGIYEAYALTSASEFYLLQGQQPRALETISRALELWRAAKEGYGETRALNVIGTVYLRLGQYQRALESYQQALSLGHAREYRPGEAAALSGLAQVYQHSGEQQKAAEYYAQALQLWRALGDREKEAQALTNLARVESERGQFSEARAHAEEALSLLETQRTRVMTEELRASYFASAVSHYEFYIHLLMQLHRRDPSAGYDAAALAASERMRARTLLETLAEAQAGIRQGVDPQLAERERRLRQQLHVQAERQMRLFAGNHTPTQAATVKQEIESLTAQYRELESQIISRSPRYAALVQPQPVTLTEMQKQLLDADTLLLEYALGQERSFLWAVTPTSLASFELPKRAEIEAAARRVYDLLRARQSRGAQETPEQERLRLAQAETEYVEAAANLSRMLLSPVAAQLGNKRLLIVADGALQYVPFAALPAPETGRRGDREPGGEKNFRPFAPSSSRPVASKPLIVEHEIISLPSASTLAVLRRETARRTPAPKAIAVLADPVFARDDPRLERARLSAETKAATPAQNQSATRAMEEPLERSVKETGLGDSLRLPRVLNTRREATGILALVAENERRQALDFEASRATAMSLELGQYRMIHFATHGLLNSLHPSLSGIVLSLVDEQGQPQDGFLRLIDIYNLKLPVELVTLSACQTGLGQEIRGEGLISLTRGFMHAGSARVVASLWQVDDRATAELMKRFYQGMLGRERLRPAAALRAAQVAMWQQAQWRDPYYWAAFVLQGEWK